ncbi:TIGR02679 family protein [Pseudonocardia sp. RS11V-5]|uniref:TIGR02679 family protein n=1 Tax=Pseudonocardia terrae TaxID=2905831 RepID=UPI001E4A7FB2|nr:TIGR02679 family protein [Pseudonocardia terrae]MCE3550177.1 TIGR02679 family protein [Pseudonocardia terrae]
MSEPWWADPALARVWAVLRERLEQRGARAEGRVALAGLSRQERHAVAGLLGRPVTRQRVSVDLEALDRELRHRSGVGGLTAVVQAATGRRLRDRPAERARRTAEREEPIALAQRLLGGRSWYEEWAAEVRRSGLLGRARDPVAAVRYAAAVLGRLPENPAAPTSRTDLAATVCGDSHALDDGRTTAALVLRALAACAGEPPPGTAAARRELWERHGIQVDLVSTTCLTLGLRGESGPVAERLDLAAAAGHPVHLTAWDLRRCRLVPPPVVLVCENPRVLESVAERGIAVPVVCASGQPTLVVLDVLRALRGSRLRYHGDFDWPGVAIADRLRAEVGVVPWRMTAADYERGLTEAVLRLGPGGTQPSWDRELGAAMRHHDRAVHEEMVLPELLAALRNAEPGQDLP